VSKTIHSNQQKCCIGIEFGQFSVRPLNGCLDVLRSNGAILESLGMDSLILRLSPRMTIVRRRGEPYRPPVQLLYLWELQVFAFWSKKTRLWSR